MAGSRSQKIKMGNSASLGNIHLFLTEAADHDYKWDLLRQASLSTKFSDLGDPRSAEDFT